MESKKVEGYLQKLGEKGLVKSWKTRWFVLDQNILSYYRERSETTPISFILLQTVKSVYTSTSMEINHKGFDFILDTEGRNYMLSAASDEDRTKWINAINNAKNEAAKPIPSSITRFQATVATTGSTTSNTQNNSHGATATPSNGLAIPTNASNTSATNNSMSTTPSGAPSTKSFARVGGKNNSAARSAIRMSDSRTLMKELEKLDPKVSEERPRGPSIGVREPQKSPTEAATPSPPVVEEDSQIKAIRERVLKEEQDERELKRQEEEEKRKKEEEARRIEEEARRVEEEARKEAEARKQEEEAQKKQIEDEKKARADEARRKEEARKREEDIKKRMEEQEREDEERRREDEKKQKEDSDTRPLQQQEQQRQEEQEQDDPSTPLSTSPASSLSLSSSPASLPPSPSLSRSFTPPRAQLAQPNMLSVDKKPSYTRAASLSSLPNGKPIETASPSGARRLNPPPQTHDISPLSSDDESLIIRHDTEKISVPQIVIQQPTVASKTEVRFESDNPFEEDLMSSNPFEESPAKSSNPFEETSKSSNPFDEPEEQRTSYTRTKIVFRKSVMPPPTSHSASQSSYVSPGGDFDFGNKSFSGLPSDYPYNNTTAPKSTVRDLSSSAEGMKPRFQLNPDGYMQITSGSELRTIIGRALAANGQFNIPGINVGPFCFDFVDGAWKVNVQKGSNEIGPRSESKEEFLESIREQKRKAIEAEDFNLASALKHKEDTAHLLKGEQFVLPGGIILCYRNSKWEITEAPSQPGLVYIQPKPKVEAPVTTHSKIPTSILNPLKTLLDSVVPVEDEDDQEAVGLLTHLEEAVSIIFAHFKETTAPTHTPSHSPTPTPAHSLSQSTPNFSQVLVSNLTRTGSPSPSTSNSPRSTSPTHISNRPTTPTSPNHNSNTNFYNNNINMYHSTSLSSYDKINTPFSVNTNTASRLSFSPGQTLSPSTAKTNQELAASAAAAIAAAAEATNAKKLNSLVRGKFCTALVGVLANGLKKQLHLLSIKEPHIWDFIEECGTWPKHAGIAGLSLGQTVKAINASMHDPNVKYRSLICEALNTGSLKEWLQLMMSYTPLTEKYFEDYALIRHPNVFQKYIDCVARLSTSNLQFTLDIAYEIKMMQSKGIALEPPLQPQNQAQAQVKEVLGNIGSLFNSLLAPKEAADLEGENQTPKKGLFGFKSVFNL